MKTKYTLEEINELISIAKERKHTHLKFMPFEGYYTGIRTKIGWKWVAVEE